MNVSKSCVILPKQRLAQKPEVGGVKATDKEKYLGLNVSFDVDDMIKDVKEKTLKLVKAIRRSLRINDTYWVSAVIQSFGHSLLGYYWTSLLSVGWVTLQEIDNMRRTIAKVGTGVGEKESNTAFDKAWTCFPLITPTQLAIRAKTLRSRIDQEDLVHRRRRVTAARPEREIEVVRLKTALLERDLELAHAKFQPAATRIRD